jgi:DNA repair photolyase
LNREIQARSLLSHVKQPDTWFGLYYNMNLYRGCQHQCIYCDSRSECYQIEDFNTEVLVKANAIELLRKELKSKRVVGTIGTGSMNDPYMPLEAEIRLTRRALEVIAEYGFPVHVITKSDLVVRDVDLLKQISRAYAAVTFTITTCDDDLAKKVEPGAPTPLRRLAAMKALAENGLLTGVTMMPILPFIEDDEQNITAIVRMAHENGASYILPAFGMTLRDRQRAYYYEKLNRYFPGLRGRYQKAFGGQYFAPGQNIEALEAVFRQQCKEHGLAAKMPVFMPRKAARRNGNQPRLF